MNVNDTEYVLAILAQHNITQTSDAVAADVILLNTCAIRENAESKIWHRLAYFRTLRSKIKRGKRGSSGLRPVVGVLGCMAERLKELLLEKEGLVDIVAGPDSYRDLPRLIDVVQVRGGGIGVRGRVFGVGKREIKAG